MGSENNLEKSALKAIPGETSCLQRSCHFRSWDWAEFKACAVSWLFRHLASAWDNRLCKSSFWDLSSLVFSPVSMRSLLTSVSLLFSFKSRGYSWSWWRNRSLLDNWFLALRQLFFYGVQGPPRLASPHLTVSLYLCSSRGNLRALERRTVS